MVIEGLTPFSFNRNDKGPDREPAEDLVNVDHIPNKGSVNKSPGIAHKTCHADRCVLSALLGGFLRCQSTPKPNPLRI